MTEYYLFATFVFILCLGMLIVMRFMFRIDRSDNKNPDMKEKEKKVLNLYEQVEDMLEGFEEYAEEVREEIATVKADIGDSGDRINSGAFDEEKIDALIGEILDKRLDNKVSEAVRRIVSRNVKEEVEIAIEELLSRIEKLEKSDTSFVIADGSDVEIKEFMPDEFAKTPDTLEELGESIQKVMKNNSNKQTRGENKKKRKRVIELYNSGMSINDIAKEVGIASSEIKLIIEFLN